MADHYIKEPKLVPAQHLAHSRHSMKELISEKELEVISSSLIYFLQLSFFLSFLHFSSNLPQNSQADSSFTFKTCSAPSALQSSSQKPIALCQVRPPGKNCWVKLRKMKVMMITFVCRSLRPFSPMPGLSFQAHCNLAHKALQNKRNIDFNSGSTGFCLYLFYQLRDCWQVI